MRALTLWLKVQLSILSMTLVWVILILFPFSLKQCALICRIFSRNIRLVPRFCEALLECRRSENISWGLLLLSTPIIAMIVLLDEYD